MDAILNHGSFSMPLSLLFVHVLGLHVELHLESNRSQERLKMIQEIKFCDPCVPVEQEQQLAFHQVDLCQSKTKPIVALDRRISSPVLVLRARIVEVLGREDQTSQEDSVNGTSHALGDWWETSLQASQIDQRGHQRRDLNGRLGHDRANEEFERRQRWCRTVGRRCGWRCQR